MNAPVSSPPRRSTHPSAPTVGAIVGSLLGGVVAAKTGLQHNPDVAVPLVSAVTALSTGLFHWLGTKIGADW
jgi:cobalamin synthase